MYIHIYIYSIELIMFKSWQKTPTLDSSWPSPSLGSIVAPNSMDVFIAEPISAHDYFLFLLMCTKKCAATSITFP